MVAAQIACSEYRSTTEANRDGSMLKGPGGKRMAFIKLCRGECVLNYRSGPEMGHSLLLMDP